MKFASAHAGNMNVGIQSLPAKCSRVQKRFLGKALREGLLEFGGKTQDSCTLALPYRPRKISEKDVRGRIECLVEIGYDGKVWEIEHYGEKEGMKKPGIREKLQMLDKLILLVGGIAEQAKGEAKKIRVEATVKQVLDAADKRARNNRSTRWELIGVTCVTAAYFFIVPLVVIGELSKFIVEISTLLILGGNMFALEAVGNAVLFGSIRTSLMGVPTAVLPKFHKPWSEEFLKWVLRLPAERIGELKEAFEARKAKVIAEAVAMKEEIDGVKGILEGARA